MFQDVGGLILEDFMVKERSFDKSRKLMIL